MIVPDLSAKSAIVFASSLHLEGVLECLLERPSGSCPLEVLLFESIIKILFTKSRKVQDTLVTKLDKIYANGVHR